MIVPLMDAVAMPAGEFEVYEPVSRIGGATSGLGLGMPSIQTAATIVAPVLGADILWDDDTAMLWDDDTAIIYDA